MFGWPVDLIGACHGSKLYIRGMNALDVAAKTLVWKHGQHNICVSLGGLPRTLCRFPSRNKP